jgi:hypothetical protein
MAIDLTTALGRLLTDAALRSEFFQNRTATLERFDLDQAAAGVLQQIDESTFERQAQALIYKRFHEVMKMLPMTIRLLGEDAARRFREYAGQFWPDGHRRHLIDAVEFCRYLRDQKRGTVCRSEQNMVEFRLSKRRFEIHLVTDYYVHDKRRLAIQVLTRSKEGIPGQHVWYLRFPSGRSIRN